MTTFLRRLLGRCAWCWRRGSYSARVGEERLRLCVRHSAWVGELALVLRGSPVISGTDEDHKYDGSQGDHETTNEGWA